MAPTNTSFPQYVDYLAEGDEGRRLAWPDSAFTVNLNGLADNPEMRQSAQLALNAWSAVTGFTFSVVTGAANITFDNESAGAFCSTSFTTDGELLSAPINVAKTWMDGFPAGSRWGLGDYGTQTFMHEIGHALGLNHGGPYDGSGTYEDDAIFAIDTYQYSIMSYFDQSNFGSASDLFLATPMIADVAAIRELYGALSVNAGNTVYGKSGFYDFDTNIEVAMTISDTGGVDTIDCSALDFGVTLTLAPGTFSDINGYVDNLAIAQGSIIERGYGSSDRDVIVGNGVANLLRGMAGNDRLNGGTNNDTLEGGLGSDLLVGGVGADKFLYRSAAEATGDLIIDFVGNQDDILLNLIDANATLAGDQAFLFRGTSAFNGAGQVRYAFINDYTYVYGNVDAALGHDFVFRLDGLTALAATDFVL
jgi:serralysin